MDLRNYLTLSSTDHDYYEDLYARYKLLFLDPGNSNPMIIVNTPDSDRPTWEEIIADPEIMLKTQLDTIRSHMTIRDDRVPSVRVEFGTGQVAAAFGCSIWVPENNVPAARDHVLTDISDAENLPMPDLRSGWYDRLFDWTDLWLDAMPEGVWIQLPDIQSAFNTAHLVRGNDIFMDLYDDPPSVEQLLDLITDFMIEVTEVISEKTRREPGWFFDWGGMWKGTARISNCSQHMISPEFYRAYVKQRDERFFEEVGGGRIHYCGSFPGVIQDFALVPGVTGLDYDSSHHDLFELARVVPEDFVLLQNVSASSAIGKRLLAGDWPEKRNLIITTWAKDSGEARNLLDTLRKSYGRVRS